MRKSFTRLFGLFILLVSMLSLQVVAQGATFTYSGLSPTDGSCSVPTSGDFTLTFNRDVFPNGLGVFALSNQYGTEYITMQIPENPGSSMVFSGSNSTNGSPVAWTITFSGKTVKLHMDYTLAEGTPYYLTASEEAIKDASGNFFEGLDRGPGGPGTLVACATNNLPQWDFTTKLNGGVTVSSLSPADNAEDVELTRGQNGTSEFIVTFNRNVFWASSPGVQPFTGYSVNAADSVWLKDGYIALYEGTDSNNGNYGGDVVAHKVKKALIQGNKLYIAFDASEYPLKANTEYYVRIRTDLIQDQFGNKWAGFNTNTGWNFSTKNAYSAYVKSIAWVEACPKIRGQIKITVADGTTASPVDAAIFVVQDLNTSPVTKAAASTSNIKPYIKLNGADNFTVTSVNTVGTTPNKVVEIVITPGFDMTSTTDYTVELIPTAVIGKPLWDSSNDQITGKSQVLTSTDYTAPDATNTVTANADGTTFDILGRLNEAGFIYYVVVANDSTYSNINGTGTEGAFAPTAAQIYTAVTTAAANVTLTSGTTTRVVKAWAADTINVVSGGVTYHERITNLMASHGRYYRVYFFATDKACGGANSIVAAPGNTYNITTVQTRKQSTLDILPPFVSLWQANVVGTATHATETCGSSARMERMGPIFVTMNEDVELAAGIGNAIPASFRNTIFNVTDNGTPVGFTATYDAATKKFTITPDSAFKSSTSVIATIIPNTIQDRQDNADFGPNGNELLTILSDTFCVESYQGPLAICASTTKPIWTPTNGETKVEQDKVIVLSWDQKLYAPVEDETMAGIKEDISNTVGDNTFVGKYIRIRSGADSTSAKNGAVVYQFNPLTPAANLDNFNFVFANTNNGATITITHNQVFESETWYYIEVESGLQSIERFTLDWGGPYTSCVYTNFSFVFQSEDNDPPSCIFYEDDDMDATADLGILDGKVVDTLSYIKVEIDEWVSLGFDGFKNLEPTDVIEDANALRPYFTLKAPNGSAIKFDVKNFSLDFATDIATFYIDPYGYPTASTETQNWVAGEVGYQVCFLGNAALLNPAYDGKNILVDDSRLMNAVPPTCATFNAIARPVAATCLLSASLNGQALDLTAPFTPVNISHTPNGLLTLNFNFNSPMVGVPGEVLEIHDAFGAITTVQSTDYNNSLNGGNTMQYVFNMSGSGWTDNADYTIQISGTAMASSITGNTCAYPAGATTVSAFHTIDGDAPVIVSFTPDNDVTGPCTEKDQDIIIGFDEPVVKQAGKLLEIWRTVPTGNTLVATIDCSNGTLNATRDSLTFDVGQLYNSITTEIADILVYGGSYFVHMPQGFVKNDVGLASEAVTTDDTYTFCIVSDPAPAIECNSLKPSGDAANPMPVFEITFSEPVTPVVGKKIQVSDNLTANVVFGFDASLMTPKPGTNQMTYIVNSSALLPNGAYPSFTHFEWGKCYYVNVDGGAFRDKLVATNVTDKIVTFTHSAEPVQTICTWTFCMDDNEGPVVKLWPDNNEVQVPVNAHLYAYINDVPYVNDGVNPLWPLVISGGGVSAAEAKQFFELECTAGASPHVLAANEWTLEFVGLDKQHLRITVYDNAGYIFANKRVMQSEATYVLRFNGDPASGNELTDSLGNTAADVAVTFYTEDVTKPTFVSAATTNCGSSASSFGFTAVISEKGTVRYQLVKGTTPVDSGTLATSLTAPFTVSKTFTGLDGSEGAYEYKVNLWASDDEQDRFVTDEQIQVEWPFAGEIDGFVNEETNRIRDFLLAPNGETAYTSNPLTCSLCDDDKPTISSTYPALNGTVLNFPLGDSIVLNFNEVVQLSDTLGGAQGQGYSIFLRDYENNLGVPLGYTLTEGGKRVTLYPLDSAQLSGLNDQFLAYTGSYRKNLDSQRKYYLEVDRYAISDDGGCGGNVNYHNEVVGKGLWFETKDATAPCLQTVVPDVNAVCVDKNADLKMVFYEANTLMKNSLANADSNFVYIYRVGEMARPHERIPMAQTTLTETASDIWTLDIPTSVQFRSGETYVVHIPDSVLKDNYNNMWTALCSGGVMGGYTWSFTVNDYLPPVPAWAVIEHQDYLDIVINDNQYDTLVYQGIQGETLNPQPGGLATSSYIKVEFDEEIFVKNTDAATATYKELSQAWLDNAYRDDIVDMLTLNSKPIGGSTWATLAGPTYNTANPPAIIKWNDFEIRGVSPDNRAIFIEIQDDTLRHWTPGLNTQIPFGMKSLHEYKVSLKSGFVYDDENCDNVRLGMGAIDNLVTLVTRNDIPPTLSVIDGVDGDVISLNGANKVKGLGSTGLTGSTDLVTCVNAEDPIRLQFSSVVVKTPYAGIGYDALTGTWVNNGINWYTEANLPMNKADILTAGNPFVEVYRLTGATFTGTAPNQTFTYSSKTLVTIDDVDIYNAAGKTNVDLKWNSNLVSEGYYQVIFKGGSVKDTVRIPNGNVFLGDSVVFRVEDNLAPQVVALSPVINSQNDIVDAIWIQYDQPIQKHITSGNIEVRWEHGQKSISIPVSSTSVVPVEGLGDRSPDATLTNDNTLYIPLGISLDDFETYYVIVPEGVVRDLNACNIFPSAPINRDEVGMSEWYFHTLDNTPPVALQFIPNNTRDAQGNIISVNDSVPTISNLSIIFDENIQVKDCTTGGLYIYHNDLLDGFTEGVDFGNYIEFIPFSSTRYEITGTDIYKGKTADMITFDPNTVFDKQGIYYVRVSSFNGTNCGIYDLANKGWTGVHDTITWSFVVSNDVSPMLVNTDLTPAYIHGGAPQTYHMFPSQDNAQVFANLSMYFTDNGLPSGAPVPVAANEGQIKIYEYVYNTTTYDYDEKLWKSIDVNDPMVMVNGNTVAINNVLLRDDINGQSFYYVIIEPGTIKNALPGTTGYFEGITNAFTWRFQTGPDNVFMLGAEILSPNSVTDGDAAKNLSIEGASTLKVKFAEGVEALTAPTGKLKIFNADADTLVQEIVLSDATASFVAETLTVVTDKLFDETNFYVLIEKGALGDTSTFSTPNDYVIGGATAWKFHTGDNTPPVPVTLSPANNATCVLSDVTLTMTFKETYGVVLNEGNVVITSAAGTVKTIPVAEAKVSTTNPNIVTMTVTGLPDTTLLTVTVPAGFVKDGGNNTLPNPEPGIVWSFTTGENTAPVLTDFAPATIVGVDTTVIVLTFSEDVNPSATGIVTVTNGNDIFNIAATAFTADAANVYSVVVKELDSETTYSVIVKDGAFVDVNAGCTANGIKEITKTFEVGDILAPKATYTPDETTLADYVGLVLSINFDDAVTAATGKVTVYNAATDAKVAEINASSFTAAEGNKVYTYTTQNLGYGDFYVLIDAGAFVDNSAQPIAKQFAGVASKTEWTFSVKDPNFDNCFNIISPLDGAVNIPTTTTLVIEFCTERIRPGVIADRYVTIAKQSNENQDFFKYEITTAMISADKKTLTINATGLEELTTYSVTIAPGAILDEYGNEFKGIIDANTWNFTTGDFTNPTVTVATATVNNVNGVVPVTSSEVGVVYLAKSDVTATKTALDAAIAQGTAVKGTVTTGGVAVDLSTAGLVAGTYKAYGFDNSGNMGTAANTVTVEAIPMMTIKAIQGEAETSPKVNMIVATKGVVTAKRSDGTGYWIQDANEAWSGIYVYDPTKKLSVEIGTAIKVVGKVEEYHGMTEITTLITAEYAAPTHTIAPVVLANIADANTEKYESVLVTIDKLGVKVAPTATNKEWTVENTAGAAVVVDDYLYVSVPVKEHFYRVTGVVNVYDAYKLAPRFAADVVDLTLVGKDDLALSAKVYPNPFTRVINISVSNEVVLTKAVITNIAGQIVKEVINPGTSIQTSELRSGVYFISLHTENGVIKAERIIKR